MAESFVLNTGARIPSVGLGTWQIEHGAVSDAIYAAVKVFFLVSIIASFPLIFFPKVSPDCSLVPFLSLFQIFCLHVYELSRTILVLS
jgi:hypothetical protein